MSFTSEEEVLDTQYPSTNANQDKSEGKKRSFLQQPRTYSKISAVSESQKESPTDIGTPKTQPIPIPAQSVLKNTITEQVDAQEFFIGDRVCIGGIKTGTLLYFGPTHIAAGLWCGISLDEPDGIHDGLVNTVRYFTCRKGHGIFAPVERVKHLDFKSTYTVSNIIKTPSRISPIPSKSTVCQIDPLEQEFELREFDDKCEPDSDDEIIGLDENGILHDSDEEEENKGYGRVKPTPRRRLPKVPRSGSQGLSRVQYMKMEVTGDKSELDEAAERLKMLNEDESVLVKGVKGLNGDEIPELPPSTGGSSGGEDSWSLSKDYLAMCDGNQKYLNITFDGDPESKASTQEASSQEPSEESPSPEFIFDQEMIEDGEFSSQPLEMSRDSSLGLLSSLALEKTDLLFELGDGMDDIYNDNPASQDTLEPNSQEKMPTPDKQQNLNSSMEFDENDVECSTPFTEKPVQFRKDVDLNETFVQENSSQVSQPVFLNSTFSKDKEDNVVVEVDNEILNKDVQQNSNTTFTLAETAGYPSNEVLANLKSNDSAKKEMVDSGISLRGSMTESGVSMNSSQGLITESSSIRRSMTDQLGHSILGQSSVHLPCRAMDNSNVNYSTGVVNGALLGNGDLMQTMVEGSSRVVESEVTHAEMNDTQLISDLKDGHQRRERPISFISTTSADTGYVPDTDSEVGTLTLNSPQEWMDKGFHGNPEYGVDVRGRSSVCIDHTGERVSVLEPIPIESDSDFGTMTGDTDNENDRAEIVHPVQDCETKLSGVEMEEIQGHEQSDDEVTQTGDVLDANTTITLEGNTTESTEIEDRPDTNLDSTFTLTVSDSTDTTTTSVNGDSCETTESVSLVTVIIADNEDEGKKKEVQTDNKKDNKEKSKTPRKKKFNVVKDFKKPNTNVVSKLSEYFKAPPPPKPVKDDKSNTEEAKNKRNSMKSKIDLSKVTSKIDNKVIDNKVTDDKNLTKEGKGKETVEKEPMKKVKRTPPKSKWDAIMSQISDQKPKPKAEVKSKLESILHAPTPVKKEEEAPKPKRKISMGIPDYSKVQSKLSYTSLPRPAAPKIEETTQKAKPETTRKSRESPNRGKNQSPARDSKDVVKSNLKEKMRRKSSPMLKSSPCQSRSTDNSPNRSRKLSGKSDRERCLSGDSPKRPGIKDKMVHIDLAESLDGRGSRTGTGSVWSSRQSSVTDMSMTGAEEESIEGQGLQRTMSEELVRRNSINAETGSEIVVGKVRMLVSADMKMQKGEINQQRRKSSLIPPTNYHRIDEGMTVKCGPKIVKPVIRQHSAPSPLIGSGNKNKPTSVSGHAHSEKKKRHRSRYQNRNKTKSKKEEKQKPPETVLAEVHTREVQRLEGLCESRTKQLNLSKLNTQCFEKAFDGMAVVVNHLAHDLEAFSCPSLKSKLSRFEAKAVSDKNRIEALEETKASLEEIIGRLKEEHKDYVNNLEAESEKSLLYQREYLNDQHQHEIERMLDQKNNAILELRKLHEEYVEQKRVEHAGAMEHLRYQHRDDINSLQKKQEYQMEELHKQHQDKLEEITDRFNSIKYTLSEKVDCLKSECDRLRDRAIHSEEALHRDSDYKVQCALAPYKNLPQEIESLKLVLEMKNDEINKLRNQNAELQKKLEELPIAEEKIIALQQKKENLEAIISMKTDHEKTLHERCQNLMRKYDKESRANKRLSMEYEELMYKLSESFSETEEMSEQKAAFYKKLGMSPTNDIPGSPGISKRLRSTSSSESSPSKSPHYRRPASAVFDDKEDRKIRRRSGNFLLDERRNDQRPTSPLAKQNPLTRSWSPSTQIPSSPTIPSDTSKNRLSQSWCVDVFDDIGIGNNSVTVIKGDSSQIHKLKGKKGDSLSDKASNTGNLVRPTDIDKDIQAENEQKDETKLNTDLQQHMTSRKILDTNADLTGEISTVKKAVGPLEQQRTFDKEVDFNDGAAKSRSDMEDAVLTTATVKCPPSKIPTNVTAEKRETKIPTRSHRESAV